MSIIDILSEIPEKMPVVSPIALSTLGVKAADAFVEQGSSMNESISKFAAVHNLNDEQIKRVCEVANITAFNRLFDKSESKTFEFPLADSLGIGVEPPMEKAASSPKKLPGKNWDFEKDLNKVLSRFDFDEAPHIAERTALFEKTAAINKQVARGVFERLGKELEDRYTFAKIAASNAISDLKRSITQFILSGGDTGTILWLASLKGVRPIVDEVLNEIEELNNKRLDRVETPPEKVIDPNHPIVIQMNTVTEKGRELEEAEGQRNLYADRIKYLRVSIKGD